MRIDGKQASSREGNAEIAPGGPAGLQRPGEREAFHLPPGVYHLVDSATGLLLQRGVVLAR